MTKELLNEFEDTCEEISKINRELTIVTSDQVEIVASLLIIADRLDRIAESTSKISDYGVLTL